MGKAPKIKLIIKETKSPITSINNSMTKLVTKLVILIAFLTK